MAETVLLGLIGEFSRDEHVGPGSLAVVDDVRRPVRSLDLVVHLKEYGGLSFSGLCLNIPFPWLGVVGVIVMVNLVLDALGACEVAPEGAAEVGAGDVDVVESVVVDAAEGYRLVLPLI